MKKFIFVVLIALTFNLYAATGSLSGEKDIRVSKTQWFDIIYPERCEKSAAILYENADRIYSEVTGQYGLEPDARIPVVLTPAVDSLNAFWAIVPYSHIVLYDTSFDSVNELAVFSENLLSVFRHELTHAVTFSMKNGFWGTVTKIFGDPMNIGPLLVSSGMAEGATLTSESAAGEGRLNDEYAKHLVKQAKIEGKFPKYYGVQGAGTLNPYYFNGAFHEWLQKEYGMEAYAKFWYYTINVQGLTVRIRFKKAFGEKLNSAWKRFIEDYEVPVVPANPVANQLAQDFFIPEKQDYSITNNAGSLFTKLTASQKNVFWLDSACNGVFTAEKAAIGKDKLKYKKLFTQTGAYDLGPSQDGRLLAVSCYEDNKPAITASIKIYNVETKQFYTVNQGGLKDGAIIQKNDEYYLVASKFVAPNNTIQIFKINFNEKGRIKSVEKISEKILPLNVFAADYTPIFGSGVGQFAYIKKDGLNFSVCVEDLLGNVVNEYVSSQERMVISSLSSAEGELYFSWACPGVMPRAGKLVLEDGRFDLCQQDLSGGIFSPVYSDGTVAFIGKFLHQNRLMSFAPGKGSWAGEVPASVDPAVEQKKAVDSAAENETSALPELPESEKFNYWKYYTKGFFIPLTIYQTDNFGINMGTDPYIDYPIGVTYLTAAPWTDGNSNSIILSAGWNTLSETLGILGTFNFGSDTSLFNNQINVKTEFDSMGWKQSSAIVNTTSGFHFAKTSIFQVINEFNAMAGRQYSFIESDKAPLGFEFDKSNDIIYYDVSDSISLVYSNVHRVGPGAYEKAGITTGISAYGIIDGAFDKSVNTSTMLDLTFLTSIYIPKLLPFESYYGLTYNLPSIIDLNFLPMNEMVTVMKFDVHSILFGMLIDRPMPLLEGVYLQNWKISAGYEGSFKPLGKNVYSHCQSIHLFDYFGQIGNGDFTYADSVYLQANFSISPNMGVLARNDFQADLFVKGLYKIHSTTNKEGFYFNFGVNLSL